MVIEFEVDTGSAVIGFKFFKLGSVDNLVKIDVNLRIYNGSILVPERILKISYIKTILSY